MPSTRTIFGAIGTTLRALSALIEHWKMLTLLALILSPIGPHIRWETQWYGPIQHRIYTRCTYVGMYGQIMPDIAPDCPRIAILNSWEWGK